MEPEREWCENSDARTRTNENELQMTPKMTAPKPLPPIPAVLLQGAGPGTARQPTAEGHIRHRECHPFVGCCKHIFVSKETNEMKHD